MDTLSATRDVLDKLLAFNTVSRNANRELMDYVAAWLSDKGIKSTLIPNHDGSKANLFASVPSVNAENPLQGGVMLSGHTDVVPVEGQNWTVKPFALTEKDDRFYGRGSADMKGFVACALVAMEQATLIKLQTPLHIALSYDEEIGCLGVRSLIDHLAQNPVNPQLCIVGEPTEMQVATRHKGKLAARATFTGQEGHSALAPHALNAIYLASDFIQLLREEQNTLAQGFNLTDKTSVPYTTIHTGIISGGTALNIVPNCCVVDFEIRNAAKDNAEALYKKITQKTKQSLAHHQSDHPNANVQFDIIMEYPGLNTDDTDWGVTFVKALTGANTTTEVAYGTEAGLFSRDLNISSVVCGPGSMEQGHKPDEFVSTDQINRCNAMLSNLVNYLSQSSPGTP